MSELSSAEENLRVIRTLMERATVYRAISAPAALIAGLIAIGAGAIGGDHSAPSASLLRLVWGSVLVAAMCINFWFLRRESARRGDSFYSPGLRMTARSMAPSLLVGFVATFLLNDPLQLVELWMVVYGLALLSTCHFAPRVLVLLGVAFLLSGLLVAFFSAAGWVPSHDAGQLMRLTFGGWHVGYAISAWPRKA